MAISNSVRKPGFYTDVNTSGGVRGLSTSINVLLVGQRLETGTVLADVPTQVFSGDEARTYFGDGSLLSLMCTAALTANANMQLFAVAMDDAGAGVAAVGNVAFTGTATESGSFSLALGDLLISILVETGETAADVADTLIAALGATQDLPVTAEADGSTAGQVNLTARNKGSQGLDISLKAGSVPDGLGVSIGVMAGGENDPDVALTLAAVAGTQYNLVCVGLNSAASLQALRDHLDTVSGPLEQRESLGAVGFRGTLSAAATLADACNSGRATVAHLSNTPTHSALLGAAFVAVLAGEEDPSVPVNGYSLKGVTAPEASNRFTRAEQETLLMSGVTPLEVGPGEVVQIVRWISTYQLNSAGFPDTTLMDGNVLRVLDFVRQQWRNRMSTAFGPDAPATNRKTTVANLRRIETATIGLLFEIEALEILENVEDLKDQVVASKSAVTGGRVDVSIPTDIVEGLHILAATFNLTF